MDGLRSARAVRAADLRRQTVLQRRAGKRSASLLQIRRAAAAEGRATLQPNVPAADAAPVLMAGGFGLRGASCHSLLPSAFLPGDVAAADALTLVESCAAGIVLVGSAVEAHGTTLELARLLSDAGVFVGAALASPFVFEGQRKATAALKAVNHLRQYADLVVVVDQQILAAAPHATLAGATLEANTVLAQSVASLRSLSSCDVRLRCDHAGFLSRVRGTLGQELVVLGVEGPAAFGSGSATLVMDHTPAAAVIAFTAAACAAVSTPFLAHAQAAQTARAAQTGGACLCLVRTQIPLPDAVEDAAALALRSLLPGSSISLALAVDSAGVLPDTLVVDLFVMSAATHAAPSTDPAPPPEARSHSAATEHGLHNSDDMHSEPPAGAVRRPRASSADLDHHTADPSPTLFARLLGLDKPAQSSSVSQRASAALASDRAASRVVTHLAWHDGGSYEGETDSDGLAHGVGRRIYANGAWYAGEWRHGQRHGWGISQTGTERLECTWDNGHPQQ